MELKIVFIGVLYLFISSPAFCQDTINSQDVIIIAPDPPFLESGVYSRIVNSPLGLHISLSGSGYNNNTVFNFSSDLQKSNYYEFTFSHRLPFNAKYSDYNNPYLEAVGYNVLDTFNFRALICNRFILGYSGVSVNTGFGYCSLNNKASGILNLGIRKYLNYQRVFNHLVSLHSFVESDFFISHLSFDWAFKYYFEFYNKNYRNISFSIGYESIFRQQDLLLNLNYKHYFFNREFYKM